MQPEQLLKHTQELKNAIKKASEIAEILGKEFPEMEEPALKAQCSVIQAFLRQTDRQEQVLSKMVRARQTGENLPVGF